MTGNVVDANYQCSTSGSVYTDQTTCQNNCTQTASCTASNYWASCSYYSSGDTCSDPPGSWYISPNAVGTNNAFDGNCDITGWGNCDGSGGFAAPGQCSGSNHAGAPDCNASTQSTSYSCPLANPYLSAYCGLGFSGSTGWASVPKNHFDFSEIALSAVSTGNPAYWTTGYWTTGTGSNLPSNNNSLYLWPSSGTVNLSGAVFDVYTLEGSYESGYTAGITSSNMWWGLNGYSSDSSISTVTFTGVGDEIQITGTNASGEELANYPTGIRVIGANFSGSVTVGTWGIPMQYFAMSGSGSTLTISAIDEYSNVSSGSLAMSCPSPNYCNASHQCTAPATCNYIPPAPTCSIGFSGSSTIAAGSSNNLTWSAANATGATLNCGSIVTATNQSENASTGSLPYTYNHSGTESCTLSLTGPGGSGSCSTSPLTVTPVDGACGAAGGATTCSAPNSKLCSSSFGNSSVTSSAGGWSWVCYGSDGGSTNKPCSANQLASLNGQCGTANGTAAATKPTSYSQLCSSGTNSSLNGSGPWSWSCNGICSGTSASCSTTPDTDWKEVTPN